MIVRGRNDSYMAKRDNDQPKPKFWQNYDDCRLILWAWMLGEAAIVWAPVELAHNGYYLHSAVYVLTIVVVATPLLFSEICLIQYSNCDVITMWNFFPLLRCFGYGTIYLMVMKTVYMLVLTTWYLEYAVHAAMAQPPWSSCEEFDEATKKVCMVKSKNTSVFQNCLEVQSMYGGDCGMKTASRCFFEQEIGNHVTPMWPGCLPRFKQTMALWCIGLALSILTLKPKFLRIGVKLALVYVGVGTFVLVCIALGAGGTWFSTSISFGWMSFSPESLCMALSKAFLAASAGSGVAGGWSRGADFRSPAAMTAVSAPLLAALASFMLSLVTFSGIKNMSFYHGDEENVVELGDNYYFSSYACMTEILIYFDEHNISGFIWFSITLVCMFVKTWLLFTYLKESLISNFEFIQIHHKISAICLAVFLVLLSYPFFCSDLTPALLDATDTAQVFTSLMFSISIYWIYGYYNHSVDIIFMIGVKASYFWKICWLLNPIFILFILIMRCTILALGEHEISYQIETLGIPVDLLLYLILIGIYVFIVLVAFFVQLIIYISARDFQALFRPSDDWGPKDDILFKSRKMFVPEIMTTEFLYRQVKKHGYSKRSRLHVTKELDVDSDESQCRQSTEWSVLTSN